MATFACDVSYYQKPVDDNYPHPWFIFRVCDGTFVDPNLPRNLAWSKRQFGKQIKGYTGYGVFRPGIDLLAVLKSEIGATPPAGFTFMLDVESWGGQVRGDNSNEINALIERIAVWLGSRKRVLVYANGGDFANLYPRRASWVRLVVASYGSIRPDLHNAIGWQYSDGQSKWPMPVGFTRSSAPFGNCDHNVFPDHSPTELAIELGIIEEDPLADLTKAQLDQIADAVSDAVWAKTLTAADGKTTHSAATFAIYTNKFVHDLIDNVDVNSKKLDSLVQMIGTAKTGVLGRVAALQSAVASVSTQVKAAQTPSVDAAPIATAVAAVVVEKVKAGLKSVTLEVK